MKAKCDKCERPATHHSVEIVKGEKVEKNLCDTHASEEGLAIKAVHAPIGELLSNFVKMHGGESVEGEGRGEAEALACPECGMTFAEFREDSLLGCGECYKAFEQALGPLIERAHDGATHHVGKIPRRAGAGEQRQVQVSRMRKRLDEAVEGEDYELAARLRDEINQIEAGQPGQTTGGATRGTTWGAGEAGESTDDDEDIDAEEPSQ